MESNPHWGRALMRFALGRLRLRRLQTLFEKGVRYAFEALDTRFKTLDTR